MVVDDEPDLLAITRNILELNGYAVHGFDKPLKALEHIKDGDCKDCGVVLSDIRMPSMTGLELVILLKKLRPELKIVLMTAFKMNIDELQKIIPTITVDGLVSKPFRSVELLKTIKECVNQAR